MLLQIGIALTVLSIFQDVFMLDVNKVVLHFIQENQSVVFPLLL